MILFGREGFFGALIVVCICLFVLLLLVLINKLYLKMSSEKLILALTAVAVFAGIYFAIVMHFVDIKKPLQENSKVPSSMDPSAKAEKKKTKRKGKLDITANKGGKSKKQVATVNESVDPAQLTIVRGHSQTVTAVDIHKVISLSLSLSLSLSADFLYTYSTSIGRQCDGLGGQGGEPEGVGASER